MSYQLLISRLGSARRIKALIESDGERISIQAINRWRHKGVPADRLIQLCRLSGGAINPKEIVKKELVA